MLLLCGQPAFVGQLNLHVHEPLRQRIVVHHEFKGLTHDETEDFLTTLLGNAGITKPLFTPDAIEAIVSASSGALKTICSLAEKALLIGAQQKSRQLDAQIIHAAYDSTLIYET